MIVRTTKNELAKQHQANFILAWSSTLVIEVGDKFHRNFKDGRRTHLVRYNNVNLSEKTST